MLPPLPYPSFSWQITQHAGRVEEDLVLGLLKACVPFDGTPTTNEQIDEYIQANKILDTAVDRSLWRDYQQILYELALVYPTSLTQKVIKISPIGKALLAGDITFPEVLTLQLMTYQYPNGYKIALSPDIREYLTQTNQSFSSLVELQKHYNISIKPLVFIWRLLDSLMTYDVASAYLTSKEIQSVVLRCSKMTDLAACLNEILEVRKGNSTMSSPKTTVARNGNDWMTLLGRTMLFDNLPNHSIEFSEISRMNREDLAWLFGRLSDEDSFWGEFAPEAWFSVAGGENHLLYQLIKDNSRDFYHVFPSVVMRYILNDSGCFKGAKE